MNDDNWVTCDSCGGYGYIDCGEGSEDPFETYTCDKCDGEGGWYFTGPDSCDPQPLKERE